MDIEALKAKHEVDFDRYLKTITPKTGDTTYSVLRSHLLFEELLHSYASKIFKHPDALKEPRFSFPHLLAIAKASNHLVDPNDWHWEALDKLNSLRNDLAHKIDAEKVPAKTRNLIELIVRSTNIPVPEPAVRAADEAAAQEFARHPGPLYATIDMVLGGLYGSLNLLLQLDADQKQQLEKIVAAVSANIKPPSS